VAQRKERPLRKKYGRLERINRKDQGVVGSLAETSTGPIATQLWERDLVSYDENANIKVQPEKVKAAVTEFMSDSRNADLPRADLVGFAQADAAAAGRPIDKATAERRLNRREAARAQAILLSANEGKVKLTPAQTERLERAAKGEYLDMVYSQYKSGDRGRILGERKEKRADNLTTKEARDEQSRYFRENIMKYGRRFRPGKKAG
jgi:hypothetical protein